MSSKPERLAAQRDITVNRRARHDYFIEESLEAGLVLTGSEVKSLRAGKAQLKDSYAQIKQGELWLLNAHISEYSPSAQFGHEPMRARKLLLHRREIDRLTGKVPGARALLRAGAGDLSGRRPQSLSHPQRDRASRTRSQGAVGQAELPGGRHQHRSAVSGDRRRLLRWSASCPKPSRPQADFRRLVS